MTDKLHCLKMKLEVVAASGYLLLFVN